MTIMCLFHCSARDTLTTCIRCIISETSRLLYMRVRSSAILSVSIIFDQICFLTSVWMTWNKSTVRRFSHTSFNGNVSCGDFGYSAFIKCWQFNVTILAKAIHVIQLQANKNSQFYHDLMPALIPKMHEILLCFTQTRSYFTDLKELF